MAHKKKKPDCIMAGMLALLTAFSPVVSVIPTYAASDNEMSTSVTIDNNTDSGDGSGGSDGSGTSGVVIDDAVQDSGAGQSDISIQDDVGDGVVSEVIGDSSSEIQIEDTDDGISIENGQDNGVILVDPSTLSGNDIQVEDTGESISVDQTMDKDVKTHALKFDFVSEHGLVKITPSSDQSESMGVRYIRVHENAEGDKIASVYDDNKQLLYTSEVSNYVAFYQDIIPEGDSFTVEAIADYGYSVATYSILMDSGAEDQEDVFDQTGFISDHYQKYTWDVTMDSDKSMKIAFAESEDPDLEYENSIGLVDTKTLLENNIQNTVSGNSISEDETDGQGSIILSEDPTEEGFETISSMADEVEIPEITEQEEKQAIADPVYEGYIRDNLNPNLVHGDDLSIVSYMHVKQTLFDMTNVPALVDTDIDNLMTREDLADYCAGQMETIVPLYLVNEDDDYFISYVNTMQRDTRARVIDWDFANANFDGEVLSDCIYDKDTGLAYIPKKDALDSEGIPLGKVQVQLAQAIDYNPSYTESVAVLDDPDGTLNAEGFNIYEDIPSFDIGSDRDSENLEVYLNGLPLYEDDDMWAYDPVTGELSINQSSVLISSVNVRDSGQDVSFFGTALNVLFGLKRVHAVPTINDWTDMESIGTIGSETTLKVGDSARLKGTMIRVPSNTGATDIRIKDRVRYYNYLPVNAPLDGATYSNAFAKWITGSGTNPPGIFADPKKYYQYGKGNPTGSPDANAEQVAMSFLLQMSSLTAGANSAFEFEELSSDIDGDSLLPLNCAHVNTPLTSKPLKPTGT